MVRAYEEIWKGLGPFGSEQALVDCEPDGFAESVEKLDQFVQHCLEVGVVPPPNLVNGVARYIFKREEVDD